jgi:hypothetical protein
MDDRERAMEAYVDAEVARALQAHDKLLRPEVLDAVREEMRSMLLTHPSTQRMLERLFPPAAPDESGKEDVRAHRGTLARRSKKAEGA